MSVFTKLTPINRRPLVFRTRAGSVFLSAASGLVRLKDKFYIVADNNLGLGILDAKSGEAYLEPILPGTLPTDEKALKRQKPDFEALFAITDPRLISIGLIAFPSGSSSQRYTGIYIPILEDGAVNVLGVIRFDLAPIFNQIIAVHGHLNIEGAQLVGDKLILFHRGNSLSDTNRIFEYKNSDFIDIIHGTPSGTGILPLRTQAFDLGTFEGVKLTITDASIFESRIFFIAAAEDTTNPIEDGEVRGTVLGEISASGNANILGSIAREKAEGLYLRRLPSYVEVSMVTDNDDPNRNSELLEFSLNI
jgi:hypothetical protein